MGFRAPHLQLSLTRRILEFSYRFISSETLSAGPGGRRGRGGEADPSGQGLRGRRAAGRRGGRGRRQGAPGRLSARGISAGDGQGPGRVRRAKGKPQPAPGRPGAACAAGRPRRRLGSRTNRPRGPGPVPRGPAARPRPGAITGPAPVGGPASPGQGRCGKPRRRFGKAPGPAARPAAARGRRGAAAPGPARARRRLSGRPAGASPGGRRMEAPRRNPAFRGHGTRPAVVSGIGEDRPSGGRDARPAWPSRARAGPARPGDGQACPGYACASACPSAGRAGGTGRPCADAFLQNTAGARRTGPGPRGGCPCSQLVPRRERPRLPRGDGSPALSAPAMARSSPILALGRIAPTPAWRGRDPPGPHARGRTVLTRPAGWLPSPPIRARADRPGVPLHLERSWSRADPATPARTDGPAVRWMGLFRRIHDPRAQGWTSSWPPQHLSPGRLSPGAGNRCRLSDSN